MSPLMLFFFFQAEDGIRDKLVTGVQTCALPICFFERAPGEVFSDAGGKLAREAVLLRDRIALLGSGLIGHGRARGDHRRSEERRVGKEGRSRWSPYH